VSNVEEHKTEQLVTLNPSNLILNQDAMKHMMEVGKFMSGATLTLPEAYRGNPANCLAVIIQAAQWNMNPFAVAQKTHFVNGTIGYEAQLVSAVINASGAITEQFHFEWFGDWDKIIGKFVERESKTKKDDNGYFKKYKVPGWEQKDEQGLGIKVSATLKNEKKPRELTLLLTQANVRNSTLWADDPRQQLAYLAQKRWARLYAPGIILGVYTKDELEDYPQERDVTPQAPSEPEPAEFYSNEEFGNNKARWKDTVLTKKKSAPDLISFVESKGKLLTEAQKTEINSWKVIEGEKVDDPFVDQMEASEKGGDK
jgi:hypothetical protein